MLNNTKGGLIIKVEIYYKDNTFLFVSGVTSVGIVPLLVTFKDFSCQTNHVLTIDGEEYVGIEEGLISKIIIEDKVVWENKENICESNDDINEIIEKYNAIPEQYLVRTEDVVWGEKNLLWQILKVVKGYLN